jgi:hypothetical protein
MKRGWGKVEEIQKKMMNMTSGLFEENILMLEGINSYGTGLGMWMGDRHS